MRPPGCIKLPEAVEVVLERHCCSYSLHNGSDFEDRVTKTGCNQKYHINITYSYGGCVFVNQLLRNSCNLIG
jgi:hypothetical protein